MAPTELTRGKIPPGGDVMTMVDMDGDDGDGLNHDDGFDKEDSIHLTAMSLCAKASTSLCSPEGHVGGGKLWSCLLTWICFEL